MIGFDTEDNSQGKVYLINFYDGKNHTTFDIKDSSNKLELQRRAIEYISLSGEKVFTSHNLEYDLINIFYPDFLTLVDFYYLGRLIYAKLKFTNKRFIDSFNFSFTSLKKIGSLIGLEKFDTDDFYNIDYCRRDTEICYSYMDMLKSEVQDEFDLPLKTTIASTSKNIFLKRFCDYNIQGKNIDNDILNAYYGGRCDLFKKGHVNKYVFQLDVNSMYPYVMQRQFPVDQFVISSEPLTDNFIAKVKVGVDKCYIPILPCRSDRLYFPWGQFETWVSNIELHKAIKEGQLKKTDIHFIEVYNWFNTGTVFKNFIKYFYNKRQKVKGRNFKDNIYKRMMNTVYGGFALKNEMNIIKHVKEGEDIRKIIKYKPPFKDNSNYILPLYITSYARVELYNLLQRVLKMGGNIIYSDTDSCYFYFDNKMSLQDQILYIHKNLNISKRLGGLSLEVYKQGFFYNLKSYQVEYFYEDWKAKQKGVPFAYRQDFFKNSQVIFKRPTKLRSGLVSKQGLIPNIWKDIVYEKRTDFKKRTVLNSMDGMPDLFETDPLLFKL
jgi:hypothetical protein